MGCWGVKLYEDDITLDVRNEYIEKLKKGINDKKINDEMIQSFKMHENDSDVISLYWFALADTQWDYGRLDDLVKEKAIYYLTSKVDLVRWEDDLKQYKLRKKVLERLEVKLNKPQPKKKRPRSKKNYQCPWEVGDVYAYHLSSGFWKSSDYYNKYILLYKTKEVLHIDDIVPIVRIKITKGTELCTTLEAFNECDYLIARSIDSYYADFENQKSVIKKTKNILYKEGEVFYPCYEFVIFMKHRSKLHNSLIYVGNFKEIKLPKFEFIFCLEQYYFNSKILHDMFDEKVKLYLDMNKNETFLNNIKHSE